MKKTFLVMTDPEKGAREDNWTIMNAFEFARFMETEEGQSRKERFERLDAASEDDTILYLECDREKAPEIKSERNRADYLRRKEESIGYELLSLDAPVATGEDEGVLTLLDLLADEETDTEEMAYLAICRKELLPALSHLDPAELDLITALYISDEKKSLNSYAAESGVCRKVMRTRHAKAIRKLRLHFRKKRLL